MNSKDIVNNVLDFLKFKVNSDSCTPDELRNISDMLTKDLDSIGTIDEIDGNPTRAFDEFYINCIAKGIDIPWEDLI